MVNYRNKRLWIFIVLCFGALAVIKIINDQIGRETRAIAETSRHLLSASVAPSGGEKQEPSAPHKMIGQKIVRKDRLSPGRDYIESIFYLDETEVARQKIVNEKVVESNGEVPQGRVDFIDEYRKTYGVEHYTRGEKDGSSQAYFANGQLNIEAYYQRGKLLRKKEYYNDGGIRLEVNYEDARDDAAEKETGIGKVYYRDGTLKYEWQMINSQKTGFKKSYNQDGNLRAAFYFDENGHPVE